MPDKHDEERKNWDDNRVKEDWKMWREITGGGRTLTQEQQERYESTRREVEKRKIIPMEKGG
jgi:hypothetical protein